MFLLSKDEQTKQIATLLKKYEFKISISEARLGINFYSKVDKKGNTVLQKIIKRYILSDIESERVTLSNEMDSIIECADKEYINYTQRLDGNTAMHLASRSGNVELVKNLLMTESI